MPTIAPARYNRLLRLCTTITCAATIAIVSGCSQASSKNQPMAAGLSGFNHTQNEIARFSVNGSSASVGGVQCCVLLPNKWAPGLHARIKWKSLDTSKLSPIPKFSQFEAYQRWKADLRKYSTVHEVSVPIPEYDSKTACGLDVHFLPCNQVKVTTSCKSYGSEGYPINEPMDMKEPAICPQ